MSDKDTIYRQAALDAMETWDKFGCDPDGKLVRYDDDKHYTPYVHYEDMVHVIKHLPSAQPERKTEDFEKGLHDMFDHIWNCEIEHPMFQDTVGELMQAVIQLYRGVVQPCEEGEQDGNQEEGS